MRGEEVLFFVALVASGCSVDRGRPIDTLGGPGVEARAWSSSSTVSPSRPGLFDRSLLLPSGRILVVGNGTSLELDPVAGTWSATSSMSDALTRPGLGLLPSGKVLAAGSITSKAGDDHEYYVVQLYDPTTRTWAKAADLPRPSSAPTMLTLTDGRLALAGTWDTASSTSIGVQLYNPTTSTWSSGPNMVVEHYYPRVVTLGTKAMLLEASGASLVDLTTATWSAAPAGPGGAVTAVGGGKAFAVERTTAATYDVATNVWTTRATPPVDVSAAAATLLSNGRVLLVGGRLGLSATPSTTAYQYDLTTNTWSTSGDIAAPHYERHEAFTIGDRAVVVGGSGLWSQAEILLLQAIGTSCTAGHQCKSGACVDSVCCGSASCPTDSTCAWPTSLGSCRKKLGAVCTAGTECGSGSCVDNRCCNVACGGQCEACDVAGAEGTCTAVTGTPHGSRAACGGAGAGTACGAKCDGADRVKCNFPGSGVACGTAGCSGSVETHVGTCSGAGACSDVPKSCGTYACGATACKTSCAGPTDCIGGYYCKAGSCVPTEGLGKDCTKVSDCATGFCVDGVCCGVASCAAGSACNAKATAKGTCAKELGTTCKVDDECGSGHCIDGVCCGTTCDGQCEACDVPSHLGQCWPVSGAPHGPRPACGGATDCATKTCDGAKDTKSCVGQTVDLTKTCAPAKCDGTRFTPVATCDVTGTCPTLAATSCVPYRCDDGGCKVTCAADTDCAPGYQCAAGKCGPRTSSCSTDGRSAIDEAGTTTSCAPYLCKKGYCARSCADSSECTDGTLCNVPLATCEPPPPPSAVADDGGCSHHGNGKAPAGFAFAIAALLLRKRGAR